MTSAVKRDYWPTARWRKLRPEDQGMDPALLNEIVGFASNSNPTMSGIVVVRIQITTCARYANRSANPIRNMVGNILSSRSSNP